MDFNKETVSFFLPDKTYQKKNSIIRAGYKKVEKNKPKRMPKITWIILHKELARKSYLSGFVNKFINIDILSIIVSLKSFNV